MLEINPGVKKWGKDCERFIVLTWSFFRLFLFELQCFLYTYFQCIASSYPM